MKKIFIFLSVLLTFTLLFTMLNGCDSNKSKKWDRPMEAEIINLGTQVTNSSFHAAAVTKDKNGDAIGCVLFDGSTKDDAVMLVVNLNTLETEKKLPLKGIRGGWGAITASDGKVYFGTYSYGSVFCYDPIKEELVNLGRVMATESQAYGFAAGNNGVIYGGTYPNCILFKATPDGKLTNLLINAKKDEQYIRSIAYSKELEVIFCGIGSHAGIVMYDEKTNKSVDIISDVFGTQEFVYDLSYSKGYLLARLSPSNIMVAFKITRDKQGNLKADLFNDNLGKNTAPAFVVDDLGKIIYCNNAIAQIFDPATGEVTDTELKLSGNPNDLDLAVLKDYHGQTLIYFINNSGVTNINLLNLKTKITKSKTIEDITSPTNLRSIYYGPDKKIYSSGYLIGGLGVYTPGDETPLVEYKGLGQSEGICSGDGIIYFGVYPGARIYSYDPTQAFSSGKNPIQILSLSEKLQDRPFGMTYGENKVFIGTLPDYGKLGGAFTIYDVLSETETVLFPVGDRSVTTTYYYDGFVYGGTTIWGGMGINPKETDAVLLIYDVKNEQFKTVDLPKKGFSVIGGLFWGPDNLLWGLADDHLFKYNVKEDKFVYFEKIIYDGKYTNLLTNNGKMSLGIDGYVYAMVPQLGFICVDPDTMELFSLHNKGADLCQDKDGNFYFYDGPDLMCYSRITAAKPLK